MGYKCKDCSKTCHWKWHKMFLKTEQINKFEKLELINTIIEIKIN